MKLLSLVVVIVQLEKIIVAIVVVEILAVKKLQLKHPEPKAGNQGVVLVAVVLIAFVIHIVKTVDLAIIM